MPREIPHLEYTAQELLGVSCLFGYGDDEPSHTITGGGGRAMAEPWLTAVTTIWVFNREMWI